MKLLTCLFCEGELDLLNPFENCSVKKVKCKKCGFLYNGKPEKKDKMPEVVILKRSK